ncbi:conserved hypothetical protein [Methylocella silvestris BL2]|uniref:Uncharacterized protein n=1 Tax=Methylocella silvestris (strain DSM 15510 / CIP 108128 / LMG 27833 / NCIMB 13906 / BL2) TaxID=395965 RepID=B8EKL6_METSB|nr:hypothetical protein [Methylocella silvestris]ACK51386.1 conserved hypothetical protein [Methylocella silvestris BL2]
MSTLSTLGNIQLDRSAAFPAKFADNPFRTVVLGAIQRRNAVLDALFYDVDVVTPEETPDLAFWLAREGAVLAVPPSGQGKIQLFLTPQEFFRDGGDVAALAVAGVGSSALGAAAFARNVADALGKPVAAVVSGYGLADVLTEALGGFFWFGGLNSIRHIFEPLDAASKSFSKTEQSLEASDGVAWTRTSKDTETVITLLTHDHFAGKLLIGHSKGNLVLSEALYAIVAEHPAKALELAATSRIVTISAKIGMPVPFHNVIDVMGEWDWFGALNSRPDIKADYTAPHAWHSTNPAFPMNMGLKVTETLRAVLPMFEERTTAQSMVKIPSTLDMPQVLTAGLRATTG